MGLLTGEERLVYIRHDGVRYLLHAPPWRAVLSEEGFGTPPLEYVTDRAPFQHGDTVRSVFLGPRPVQLVVTHNFCSRADYWTGRQNFLDALRPTVGIAPPQPGKLLYYLSGGRRKRQLDVLLDSGPGFVQPEGGWREWSFTEAIRFTAHNPTWYDPTGVITNYVFTTAANQLVFPITFPILFSGIADYTSITYDGSWAEYPTIIITGPVTGFRIENITTGDEIGLDGDIVDGEVVTINLTGIKTITNNLGDNLLSRLTSDSDLSTFSLLPDPGAPGGVNQIRISGSGTTVASFVSIVWYRRYFGI